MRAVSRRESDAILGAMRQVALAGGGPITHADTASIAAAARYLLRRVDVTDVGALPAVEPADLVAILKDRDVASEAIKYLAVMSHMDWVIADMTMRNAESVVSGAWGNRPKPAEWILPYAGDKADPALVARYDALGKLPPNTFGWALWDFDKKNGYPFPGDPSALNAAFATPHDATHVISGYDTSYRGEILVSTFTAAMHPINPMAGHILPVIFNGHLGVRFNEVATPSRGGFDPDEFWHAWARGRDMTADLFAPDWNAWDWIEHDLEQLRRDWNVAPPGHRL